MEFAQRLAGGEFYLLVNKLNFSFAIVMVPSLTCSLVGMNKTGDSRRMLSAQLKPVGNEVSIQRET